ncbi:hypothetical protein TCEA9_17700 [Thermobrachium celere]|nr:hypothetical protein TCEA9_17700 [Thermobrachium celere]
MQFFLSFLIVSICYVGRQEDLDGILIGATIIVIMGIIDDKKELKPKVKLIFQILASLILIAFGIKVNYITIPLLPGTGSFYVGWLGIPITVLWVVGITNAVNLIDGLDGLACGVCSIAALSLFGVSMISGRVTAGILSLILSGACLGFLYYNFNPASIFMGDTGSQFLGFTLAAISIQGAIKSAAAVAVAVPILALGLPIYDTLFAMIRRKINNRPIMEADKGHLHHRLLALGYSQRQVAIILYIVSGIFGVTSILAMSVSTKKSYLILMIVCTLVLAFATELGLLKKTKR